MKTEVGKLDVNKLVNVLSCLNNFNTSVGDLNVYRLKTDSVDLKKLNDVASKEVFKNTKFNKLKTKRNNLEDKTSDVSTLIQTNQYNTNKQSFEKKIGDLDKQCQTLVV